MAGSQRQTRFKRRGKRTRDHGACLRLVERVCPNSVLPKMGNDKSNALRRILRRDRVRERREQAAHSLP